jgi:hypothetical protein
VWTWRMARLPAAVAALKSCQREPARSSAEIAPGREPAPRGGRPAHKLGSVKGAGKLKHCADSKIEVALVEVAGKLSAASGSLRPAGRRSKVIERAVAARGSTPASGGRISLYQYRHRCFL